MDGLEKKEEVQCSRLDRNKNKIRTMQRTNERHRQRAYGVGRISNGMER